jgi:8-oxo-dGTP diphosphatase
MFDKLNEKVIEAAGGIVERDAPDGPLIAVIYRERYGGEWGLPKGKRQVGESWQETALREVEEEIGQPSVITGIAGATGYLVNGVPKLVLYWRMHVDYGTPFLPNDEVRKLTWLTPRKAIEQLKYQEEVTLVKLAYNLELLE